jgi:FkbM family methyltransferase
VPPVTRTRRPAKKSATSQNLADDASCGSVAPQDTVQGSMWFRLIEQRLKVAIQATFHSVGLDIRRHAGSLARLRCRLLRSGAITVVIDVGANIGQYAGAVRRCGFQGRIVSVEPLPEAHTSLVRSAKHDSRWEQHNLALGKRDGNITINVSANSVSSSALPMLTSHLDAAPQSVYTGTVLAKVRRLDTLRDQLVRPADRVWLKLDVQGLESDVLEGAGGTLEQVAGIEAELSLVPLYKDQELFYEVSEHLYSRDFFCAFLEPEFADPRSGHMLAINALFLRRGAFP